MVAINTAEESDPVTKARAFQQRHALTYPILVDAKGVVRKAYAVYGFPTNLIIDRDGMVRYAGAGFDPTDLSALVSKYVDCTKLAMSSRLSGEPSRSSIPSETWRMSKFSA